MIGYLKGVVVACAPERVLLDVHGVGYDISIPLSTFYELENVAPQQPVGLFVHTHVRQDAIELFGFWNEREKLLFEKLIQVSGIGPRLARVILSGMSFEHLLSALAARDTARLATIPGVGNKTAERMVVDLKDRIQTLITTVDQPSIVDDTESDLVEALMNLGYRHTQAVRAVSQVREEHPDAQFPELLRLSLQRLSRV